MYKKLKDGYLAEELFILECLRRDIPVSRPVFNVEPYDFVCEIHGRFVSVQVKKSWTDKKGRKMFCLLTSSPRVKERRPLSQDERINYFAVLVDNMDWYIIPRKALEHVKRQTCLSNHGPYKEYLNDFDFNKSSPAL